MSVCSWLGRPEPEDCERAILPRPHPSMELFPPSSPWDLSKFAEGWGLVGSAWGWGPWGLGHGPPRNLLGASGERLRGGRSQELPQTLQLQGFAALGRFFSLSELCLSHKGRIRLPGCF